jgi:(p)ppGpp synthase/HD superfamily hydrolase
MNPREWCIEQHRKTNHFYSEYLPYEFHLRMVDRARQDWEHLLPDEPYNENERIGYRDWPATLKEVVRTAVWAHDVLEDCRVSYKDCRDVLGTYAADIVYVLTNEKGKNRAERANAQYYEGIRNTKGAVFCKLCDRIANVQYSKLTKSRMFEMYKAENAHFVHELGYTEDHQLRPMFDYLSNLFL